jgi:8-oxo-dGTP pyrophosphatase MutT (NUDIX family)
MIIGQGAGVILTSENGFVLLQHRDKRNRWNQDSWSEFGGQVEEGEKPEETVKRELMEELGIEVTSLKFFKKYNIRRKKGTYRQFVFTAPVSYSAQTLKKQQREGDDLAFFTAEEIENLKTADYTKKILKDYFNL